MTNHESSRLYLPSTPNYIRNNPDYIVLDEDIDRESASRVKYVPPTKFLALNSLIDHYERRGILPKSIYLYRAVGTEYGPNILKKTTDSELPAARVVQVPPYLKFEELLARDTGSPAIMEKTAKLIRKTEKTQDLTAPTVIIGMSIILFALDQVSFWVALGLMLAALLITYIALEGRLVILNKVLKAEITKTIECNRESRKAEELYVTLLEYLGFKQTSPRAIADVPAYSAKVTKVDDVAGIPLSVPHIVIASLDRIPKNPFLALSNTEVYAKPISTEGEDTLDAK